MAQPPLDTDYLVIGAGAAAMAFVDTLLTDDPVATVAMVDRHHRPGGHWNDAYPFVRLHQPSAFYGVNSRELSQGTKDHTGWNLGLFDLASGAEVLGYFDQVMQQRFKPSGRVQYFPMNNVVADDAFEHLLNGERRSVNVRRKIVDATYSAVTVPAMHKPRYSVADGVRCVPLNALPQIAAPQPGYVVVGAGKTGIDACLWLLEHGVAPTSIRWIMPRDAWLQDRANIQPGDEFLAQTFGAVAAQFEAVAAATSVPDLFDRLEAAGQLLRIDPRVRPSIYRCATVSQAELAQLRRIEGVVRLGHVRAVEATRIVLDDGSIDLPEGTLVVDCTASAVQPRALVPVWSQRRITLQMVRTCQPTFSCALIAHLEATLDDEAQKNDLCAPVCNPYIDTDWLRMLAVSVRNRGAWSKQPAVEDWLAQARLDGIWAGPRRVQPGDTIHAAVVARYRAAAKAAMPNLQRLMAAL